MYIAAVAKVTPIKFSKQKKKIKNTFFEGR